MGGDDSQKLLPWRGIYSSPGRSKPPVLEINTLAQRSSVPARLFQRRAAGLGRVWSVAWRSLNRVQSRGRRFRRELDSNSAPMLVLVLRP